MEKYELFLKEVGQRSEDNEEGCSDAAGNGETKETIRCANSWQLCLSLHNGKIIFFNDKAISMVGDRFIKLIN